MRQNREPDPTRLEEFCYVKADTACTDPEQGGHLVEFVTQALPDEIAADFEKHTLECFACAVGLTNWRNIIAAIGTKAKGAMDTLHEQTPLRSQPTGPWEKPEGGYAE
ncbi:MAG: hypothetical protein HYZ51_01270 [Candidatus Doudnabacteria bacterium]|nr:hypothetical protein [Candidatus Doudnabacteria bacterium]